MGKQTPQRSELVAALQQSVRRFTDEVDLYQAAVAERLGMHATDLQYLGFVERYGPTIRVPAFLVLDVRDPQRFIDGSTPVKRWLLRGNLTSFGSPVAISPASVHIDADELARYIRRIVGPS